MTSDPIIKIKAGDLTSETFDFTISHASDLTKLARLPFMVSFTLLAISHLLPEWQFLILIGQLVEYCAMAMFAVAVHRYYLLGEPPRLGAGIREIKFTLCSAFVALIWIIPLMIAYAFYSQSAEAAGQSTDINVELVLFSFIGVVFAAYTTLRLGLMFPAIAISKSGHFLNHMAYSWKNMQGNVFSFSLAVLALGFVVGLFTGIPELIMEQFIDHTGTPLTVKIIRAFIELVSGFLMSLFMVLLVSYIFKKTEYSENTFSST